MSKKKLGIESCRQNCSENEQRQEGKKSKYNFVSLTVFNCAFHTEDGKTINERDDMK